MAEKRARQEGRKEGQTALGAGIGSYKDLSGAELHQSEALG